MIKLSLKGFGSRKVRVALTVVAVALGVALISGTYVLTDTINASFDKIFVTANKGTDVAISAQDAVGDNDQGTVVTTIPASLLGRVQAVDGVSKAVGSVDSNGALFKANGDRVGGGGAPTQIFSDTPAPFNPYEYVDGHAPSAENEVGLLKSTADNNGIKVGDTVSVVGASGPKSTMKVVGLANFGGAAVGGFVAVTTTLAEAQRLAGQPNAYDQILVAADQGVTPDELATRIKALHLPSVVVRTGQQQADKSSSDVRDQLGVLRTALLAFAVIALFVGAFIIFNTFSITVAQRMREFALLRTLGATRRQVMGQVLFEGLLIGLIGAVVGFLFGLALAVGLRALFKAVGADLPASGLVIESRTVIVALLVGTIVTLISGLAPAIRATRVPPIAALREGAVLPPGRGSRFITPGGIVMAALGVLALAVGLFGGGGILLVAVGAGAVFLGIALLSPRLVGPLTRIVGKPLPGLVGRLARENAMRQPGRTAVTAAALMVGVTLVAFVSIFASGAKATINAAVDTAGKPGTLIVENTDGFSPIPPQLALGLGQVPGVTAVAPVSFTTSKVAGVSGKTAVSAVSPKLPQVFNTTWKEGSDAIIPALGTDGAVLAKKFADDHDFDVGSKLRVTTPIGKHLQLTVRGIADDNSGLFADVTISQELARSAFGQTEDALDFVGVRPQDEDRVKGVIDAALKANFPIAEAKTLKQFKDQQAGQINGLVALIYVLLSLSVIVSLFGIVNTLVLSIYERTREIGMLRAIGTSRVQIKQMIRYEAVITSLIGAVIGVVLGTVFAIAITVKLSDQGFKLSIPVLQLVILLVLAAIAGVLAAILPARRAAKLNVLDALAYE